MHYSHIRVTRAVLTLMAPCALFSLGCSSSTAPAPAAVDSGVAHMDSGVAHVDSGPGPMDSGSAPQDSGVAPQDSGVAPTDSGGATDSGGSTCNGTPTTHDVQVGGASFTFTPSTLTVCTGDTVHWVWMGTGHNVTSGTVTGGIGTPDNKFCNPNNMNCAAAPLESTGTTYDNVFMTAGSFPYYCSAHASLGMTGTITVQ